MKYIAYGSNMVTEQMAYRCPDARLIGTGYLEKTRLEFYLHATVERTHSEIDRVPVAVWEISTSDEHSLDCYEGFPSYYTKENRMVTMTDGSRIKGMVYIMNRIRPYPPTESYYRGIEETYRKMGFGSEIKRVLEPALKRSLERETPATDDMP